MMLTSDDKGLVPMDVEDKGRNGKGKTKDGKSKGAGKDNKGGKGKGDGGEKGYESWNKEGCGKGNGEKTIFLEQRQWQRQSMLRVWQAGPCGKRLLKSSHRSPMIGVTIT